MINILVVDNSIVTKKKRNGKFSDLNACPSGVESEVGLREPGWILKLLQVR